MYKKFLAFPILALCLLLCAFSASYGDDGNATLQAVPLPQSAPENAKLEKLPVNPPKAVPVENDPELIDESATGKSCEVDLDSAATEDDKKTDKGTLKKTDGQDLQKPAEGTTEKAAAAKKQPARVKVFAGTWDESHRNPSRSADYCFSYYGINYGVLHARFDTFNYDRRRYWLCYGKIPVAKSPDFVMTISPGIMINNLSINKVKRDQFYEGGFTWVQFPKLGISILDKSYGGTDGDFHHTFADLKVTKNFDLSLFNYSSIKAVPDTYLGPKFKWNVGQDTNFHIWYGWSLVPQKPQARLLNISGTITF
jgi:hypothetical protein